MNDKKQDEFIIKKYNERYAKYGLDPRSLGWLKGRQKIRFKILAEIGNLDGCSILDIGCGFGDFYQYLVDDKSYEIDYYGVDLNNTFIQIAEKNHPKVRFDQINFMSLSNLNKYDYVIASGIFEYKFPDQEKIISQCLKQMYELSIKGVSVNFLSSYVDFETEEAYHANPEYIFTISKKLTKRVVLRHDYLPYEFTTYMYTKDKVDDGLFREND